MTFDSSAFSDCHAWVFSSLVSASSNLRSAHTHGISIRRLFLRSLNFFCCRAMRKFFRHDRRFRQLHFPLPARPPADDTVPRLSPQAATACSGRLKTSEKASGQAVQRTPYCALSKVCVRIALPPQCAQTFIIVPIWSTSVMSFISVMPLTTASDAGFESADGCKQGKLTDLLPDRRLLVLRVGDSNVYRRPASLVASLLEVASRARLGGDDLLRKFSPRRQAPRPEPLYITEKTGHKFANFLFTAVYDKLNTFSKEYVLTVLFTCCMVGP